MNYSCCVIYKLSSSENPGSGIELLHSGIMRPILPYDVTLYPSAARSYVNLKRKKKLEKTSSTHMSVFKVQYLSVIDSGPYHFIGRLWSLNLVYPFWYKSSVKPKSVILTKRFSPTRIFLAARSPWKNRVEDT